MTERIVMKGQVLEKRDCRFCKGTGRKGLGPCMECVDGKRLSWTGITAEKDSEK